MGLKSNQLTSDEAKVLWTVLNRTWIPQGYHDEFLSGLRKLESIAEDRPAPPSPLLIDILK